MLLLHKCCLTLFFFSLSAAFFYFSCIENLGIACFGARQHFYRIQKLFTPQMLGKQTPTKSTSTAKDKWFIFNCSIKCTAYLHHNSWAIEKQIFLSCIHKFHNNFITHLIIILTKPSGNIICICSFAVYANVHSLV